MLRNVLIVCLLAVVVAVAGAGTGSARSAAASGGALVARGNASELPAGLAAAVAQTFGQAPLALATAPSETKLIGSDGAAGDQFGVSVALSGDRNVALVGAAGKNVGQGVAYVFVRDKGVWTQRQELTASDGAALDLFGWSVALSKAGKVAVVGAPGKSSYQGAAYVFVRDEGVWSQRQKLSASDGAAGDEFGYSAALSKDGKVALVGAPDKSTDQGAAYVFVRDEGMWSQQQELNAGDGAAHDFFGASVELGGDGNLALVGAPAKDSGQGAVYVFAREKGVWTQRQELSASDGAPGDEFGWSVAMSKDGNVALVGAPAKDSNHGAAYVFARDKGVWTQRQELSAGDGAASDAFGYSVALSGDANVALVGAPGKSSIQGAAYAFVRDRGMWTQRQELSAGDGAAGDIFGYSVALSEDGNLALIGAASKSAFQGAAYVYQPIRG